MTQGARKRRSCSKTRLRWQSLRPCYPSLSMATGTRLPGSCISHPYVQEKCPFQGNGRVYVVSEAAALRQFLCFLLVHFSPVVI